MWKKLLHRENAAVPEVEPLENLLAEVLTPVTPRPEFAAALQERLMHAYPQVVASPKTSPVSPLTGLGTALKHYTSAQVTLNGLRLWRVLLGGVILLLGGARALAGGETS